MLLCKQEVWKNAQEERTESESRQTLSMHKTEKKAYIAETLHANINGARLTALTGCEVCIFSRDISQLSKIHPLLSSHLTASASPMGKF